MYHLLTGFEFSKEQYLDIINTAIDIKKDPKKYLDKLKGLSAAIIFEKPSLRTRSTFEIALHKLGAHGVYLDLQNGDLGVRESVADYAQNLSRWTDCLVGRVFRQSTLEELAQKGTKPVINALSDLYHPAQAMADYMTMYEHLGALENKTIAYVGDGNNVANSLLVAGSILGVNVICATPLGHGVDPQIYLKALDIARKNNTTLKLCNSVDEIGTVDALYTDTWVSMGDDTPIDTALKTFLPYQVNQDLVDRTDAKIVMHCLPAHRGYEITDDVMDGIKSVVFDEAENRLHIHMSLLIKMILEY